MATYSKTTTNRQTRRRKAILANGTVGEDKVDTVVVGYTYHTRNHVSTKKKPKGKWIPPKAYSMSFRGANSLQYNSFYQYGKRSDNFQFYVQGTEDYNRASEVNLPSFDGDLTAKAVLAARLKLKDQKVNVSVAFAERKQTADLFSSVTERVAGAIDACRKRDLKRMKRALGISPKVTRRERKILKQLPPRPPGSKDPSSVASSLWLENAYGVTPLLQDVRGSAEQLAQNDVADPDRYHVFVTATRSRKDRSDVPSYAVSTYGVPYKETCITEDFMSSFVRLDFKLEQPSLHLASQLGFTNPLGLGWEKLPYSFVADWLYPIGDYISSLDATLGFDFRGGSYSDLTRRRVTYLASVGSLTGTNGTYKSVSCGGRGTWSGVRLNRGIYTSAPVPELVYPTNPFTGKRVVNALALLRQAVR